MLAFLGFAVQALTQGEGALGELAAPAHLAYLGALVNGVILIVSQNSAEEVLFVKHCFGRAAANETCQIAGYQYVHILHWLGADSPLTICNRAGSLAKFALSFEAFEGVVEAIAE